MKSMVILLLQKYRSFQYLQMDFLDEMRRRLGDGG